MKPIGHFEVGGLRLRANPARDACFRLVQNDSEMHEYEGSHPLARRETVHRHMSNEITSLDIAAQCLAEFPDAPWELRLELARQCWDEARHVSALARRLAELGGAKGEFPISAFEWNVTCALDDLPGRAGRAGRRRTHPGNRFATVQPRGCWNRRLRHRARDSRRCRRDRTLAGSTDSGVAKPPWTTTIGWLRSPAPSCSAE